jgi:hypothetical protein
MARHLRLPSHVLRIFVLVQLHEPGVPQVAIECPFDELELADYCLIAFPVSITRNALIMN